MSKNSTCTDSANAVPEWLKVGALLWCGFAGWIIDIAVGDTAIMVKVESPKRKLFNRNDEWLPYNPDMMHPLTEKEVVMDLDICDRHFMRIRDNYTDAAEHLRELFWGE